jgi:hypothetical protein
MAMTRTVLLLAGLALVAGCAEAPAPFYTTGDVVTRPDLEGCWDVGDGASMSIAALPGGGTELVLRCAGECDPLAQERDYVLTPFALDGRDYLDVAPRAAGGDGSAVAPHMVVRVQFVGSRRALVSVLNPKRLESIMQDEDCPIELADVSDNMVLLLAGTTRLRELLLRHGDEIFFEPSPAMRCEDRP